MADELNLLGAITAHVVFASSILVFVARLVGAPRLEAWSGWLLLLTALPFGYLLSTAPSLGRPALYYIQVSLMLAFLVVLALLDYALKVEFRHTRWKVIAFVMLFFGATGGMIGLAAHAGRWWMLSAVALFLIMGVLAFVQRAVTGK